MASASSAWHGATADETLAAFVTLPDGLSSDEASRRLAEIGPNSLPEEAPVHPLRRFLVQFHNPLIYFLLVAALTALLLDRVIDAVVILLVVLVNAIVGFVQEGRAAQALGGMRALLSPHAMVMRDGMRVPIDVANIIPGDIVALEPGDRVPADLRLLRARGLAIEEAALTGESVAAEKREDPVAADAPLGDRSSMAFSGTLVAKGQAIGVVVATGSRTEIGRISGMLHAVPPLVTP